MATASSRLHLVGQDLGRLVEFLEVELREARQSTRRGWRCCKAKEVAAVGEEEGPDTKPL